MYVCIIRTVDLSGITCQIATAITTNGTGQAIKSTENGNSPEAEPTKNCWPALAPQTQELKVVPTFMRLFQDYNKVITN